MHETDTYHLIIHVCTYNFQFSVAKEKIKLSFLKAQTQRFSSVIKIKMESISFHLHVQCTCRKVLWY